MTAGVSEARLSAVLARETAALADRMPRSRALRDRARTVMPDGVPMAWMAALFRHEVPFAAGGEGARFVDADGNAFLDFNLCDLSNTAGYGDTPVSRRLAEVAARGVQYLLPVEDAVHLSEELARRTGFPFWQYTLSASGANTEIIRIARAMTGRSRIVLFDGRYHGHVDALMAEGGAPGANAPARPEALGILASATSDTVNLPFNDLATVAEVLAAGDVALVLVEPALTNCSLVLPDPGFLTDLHRLCQSAGTLLALDETHTWQFAYGGLTREMGLEADFLTLGKGLGSGVALGVYGMTAPVAAYLEGHLDGVVGHRRGLAIGGTTYANPLALAATRAMLEEVATPEACARIATLGTRLSDGLDRVIAAHGLPWCAFRYGPRSGFCLTPELPRNLAEAMPSLNEAFSDARRAFMANRGIWDAIWSAGPQVSFAHTAADIDRYVEVADAFLAEVVAP